MVDDNKYYGRARSFTDGTTAQGKDVRDELDAIEAGFSGAEIDVNRAIKMPSGNHEMPAQAADRVGRLLGFDDQGDFGLLAGLGKFRGNFAGNIAYNLRDLVVDSTGSVSLDSVFICNKPHTATSSLAGDISNWDYLVNMTKVNQATTAAAASATTATSKATDAAASATTATSKATDAAASATTATSKATAAAASTSAAGWFASTAGSRADAATRSASAASTNAATTYTYATQAGSSATAAAASATSATNAASLAGSKATAAAASAVEALATWRGEFDGTAGNSYGLRDIVVYSGTGGGADPGSLFICKIGFTVASGTASWDSVKANFDVMINMAEAKILNTNTRDWASKTEEFATTAETKATAAAASATLASSKATEASGSASTAATKATEAAASAASALAQYKGAFAFNTVFNGRDIIVDTLGSVSKNSVFICKTTHTSAATLALDIANWDYLIDMSDANATKGAVEASAAAAAASATSSQTYSVGAWSSRQDAAGFATDAEAARDAASSYRTSVGAAAISAQTSATEAAASARDAANSTFAQGTKMLFYDSVAPVGWTKTADYATGVIVASKD